MNNLNHILENPLNNNLKVEESIELSKKYKIPIHPKFLFFWNELSINSFILFLENLKKIEILQKENDFIFRILNDDFKKKFELIGVEHRVVKIDFEKSFENKTSFIEIDNFNSKILLANIGIYDFYDVSLNLIKKHLNKIIDFSKSFDGKTPCEILSNVCEIEIRDKGGSYIGSRMGRPEKAKLRDGFKIDGKIERPHGIFPIGDFGGRLRNIVDANQNENKIETLSKVYEDENGDFDIYRKNFSKNDFKKECYFEKYSGKKFLEKEENSVMYKKISINLNEKINEVREILSQTELSKLVKGVSKLESETRVCEHLSKAFLREKNKIRVNKDGTTRYDMIEMGLTHFKPKEIGTSIEKLKSLGYLKDYLGEDLKDENQLLEIFPQDVILPDCEIGEDEKASDFIIRVSKFIDDELELLYKKDRFYNFKSREDTIGHLIVGLAPHTSAGIVGRIIGYSKTQGCFSHPVWHAAQRRNLDGDENGIILLLDCLINFSKEYLPNMRGRKTMDTPLVLTTHLILEQIDDEVFGVDIVKNYDLDFYRKAKNYTESYEIKSKKIVDKIKEEDLDKKYFDYHFTHNTNDLNDTILYSSYKSVPDMSQKMNLQLSIGKKIRAVDENEVGNLIIDKHFLKDIKGNLRKFGMQKFRCAFCSETFRRPPLNSICPKCKNSNIIFTISEGSIKKYLDPSFNIIENYNINPYLIETLELTKLRIIGVFGEEKKNQKSLNDFFGN